MTRHKNTGMPMGSMKKAGGGVQTSADTARKLATEMGGMKKGGKPKASGLAVMIAIGSPMKKPNKKMMDGGSNPAIKTSGLMAKGGMKKPVKKMGGGMAYGGAGAMASQLGLRGSGLTGGGPQPYKRTASDQANIDSYATGRSPERGAMFGAALDKRRQQEALQKQNGRGLPTPPALAPQRSDYSPERVAEGNAFLTAPRTSGPMLTRPMSDPFKPLIQRRPDTDMGQPMAMKKGGDAMKPVKKAQGGAGKVRKGMMTPEGKIIDAMNKIRGK